jgi:hypothetical protein
MTEETEKTIKDRLEQLPQIVQDAILHSGWQEKIQGMAKRYSLHVDQTGDLQLETFMVMLGLDDPENFSTNLVANLGLSKLIADQLSMEVNDMIFKPIRIELQKLQATEENNEENPTKESILEGIEHPVETVHPHEGFLRPLGSQLTTPGPLDRGMPAPTPHPDPLLKKEGEKPASLLPATEVTPLPTVTIMPGAGTTNIVHDRLSQMVQMAKKEIQTTPAPKTTETPKPAKDPYREPIN